MTFVTSTAYAVLVPIHTSCGKTVYLESSDYATAEEMALAANEIDKVVCPKEPEEFDPEITPAHP